MKNKIIYSIIVCFWALMTSLSAQSIGLRFPDTTMVVGDTIVLPLYVDSTLTGQEVYSLNLEVRFPDNYFKFVEVSASDMSSSFGAFTVNSSQTDKVLISGASGTPLGGTGVLLYVHLQALRSYQWGQWVELYSSSFFNEGLPTINTTKGKVKIIDGPIIKISPNETSLLVGETLEMSVSGDTIGPFVYDVAASSVGSIDENGLFSALAPGSTKVEVRDSNNTVDETDDEINVFGFSLSSPNDLTQWQGGQIDIPVIIHNTGGDDFISGSFTFQYANAILSFNEMVDSATLLANASIEYVQVADNKLMVNFASGQVLGDDSVLLYLRFDISRTTTGTSYFDYSDIVFNENVVGLNRKGTFKTINYQTVNFYSNKYELIAGEVCPTSVSGGLLPYTFTSNNEAAATISDEGEITAIRGGVVNFTATDSVGSQKASNAFTVYDTYVEIADTTGPLLTDYLLPIYMGDLPSGTSVNAFQMDIIFRQPELEFIELVSANSLSDGWSLAHSLSSNKLMISGAGTNALTQKGILFYVKYRLTSDFTLNETVSVTIDKVMLNEGSPTALDRDGSIKCVKREDMMMKELLSPLSDCELSAEEEVSVLIRNNGFLDYSKGDSLLVSYTFDRGLEVVDTIVLDQTFTMKSDMQYTFAKKVDMSQNRQYHLEVKTKLSSDLDGNVGNDKLTQYITNYTTPTLNLGDDISVCSQDPIVITAPEDFFSYEWSTGAVDTNAVFIDTTSTVWLKVTNSNGCVAVDTIEVEVYEVPSAPQVIYDATQACVGDSIRLEAPAGFAQYRWTTGQTDSIIYAFASGDYGVWVYNEGMCESDTSALVSVTFDASPVANFSYTNEGLRVSFTNLSTSATDYRWFFGDGTSSTEMNPVHTYEWRDSDYVSLKSTSVSDDSELFRYYVRLVSSNSTCDDFWLDTIPASAFLANRISKTLCYGDSYEFGGEMLNETGVYYHNFALPTGKDSIVQLNLTMTPIYDDTLEIDICHYEDYEFGGKLLTQAGTYTDSALTMGGCDSISTLILGVMPNRDDSISATICDGSYYVFGSDTLWTAGVYARGAAQSPVAAPVPCMRTVLTLSVEPAGNTLDTLVICDNELPFDYHGHVFPVGTTSGTKSLNLASPYGCVADVKLDLTVVENGMITVVDYGAICPNTEVNNTPRTDEDYDTITYKNKCDYDSLVVHRWDMIYPPSLHIFGATRVAVNTPSIYFTQAATAYVEWSLADESAEMKLLSDSSVELTFSQTKAYMLYAMTYSECGQYTDSLSIAVDSLGSGLTTASVLLDIEVYPNPGHGIIQFRAETEMRRIVLYDALGAVVTAQSVAGKHTTINTNGLCEKGLYVAKVTTKDEQSVYLKLLIE